MKIVSVVGARPQFIKAAMISRLLRLRHAEILLHTGQHYDPQLSAVFFEELGLPQPEVNLGVGSAPHGAQTAAMLAGIERVLQAETPDWVLVYGDTNSTLAGALAAAKLHIPLAHIEAGLRSFNRRMPEEINRVVTDHISDLLLCPSQQAVENLAREGIHQGVHLVGDVMADALRYIQEHADKRSDILNRLGLEEGGYLLVTVHRADNTDHPARLRAILTALMRAQEPVVFPIHPRTKKALDALSGLTLKPNLKLIEPLGYIDMVRLESSARMILTDSGGVQKEAYWLGVPCVTLRAETEWIETVKMGWNILVDADSDRILEAIHTFKPPPTRPPLYGDGQAAMRCVALLNSEIIRKGDHLEVSL